MSSTRYIPLVTRARKALDELQYMMRDERLARCSTLRWLGEKTDREPSLLASAIYALLLTMVLLNPNDIAPCIVNSIGMIPAWDTFRLLVSQDAGLAGPAETDSASKKLLDYLLVLGSSIFVEQLLRNTTVSRVMPFWWIMKVAVVLWFLMGSAKHEMPGVEMATSLEQVSTQKSDTSVTNTIEQSAERGLRSRRNGQPTLDLALQSPNELAESTLETSPTKAHSPVSEAVVSPTESAEDTPSSESDEDPFGEDFDEQSTPDDASPPITPSSPVKVSQDMLDAPSPISEASLSPLSPPMILPSAALPPEPVPDDVGDTSELVVPAAGEIRRMSLDELLEMAEGEEESLAMGSPAGGRREDMDHGGRLVAAS